MGSTATESLDLDQDARMALAISHLQARTGSGQSLLAATFSWQVSFCRCNISGLELVFSVVDLGFRAVDQLIGVKPSYYSKAMSKQSIS